MKVRMLSTLAGTPGHTEGDVADVDERIGRAWIADGLAVSVQTSAPVETGARSLVGADTAASRPARRGRG